MSKPTIIHTNGDDLVILNRRDYEALLARAGSPPPSGKANDIARYDAIKAALVRGDEVLLPENIWQKIEAGDNPVKILRQYRALTQADLAQASGLSQGYIAEIESGKKDGATQTLKAIAAALGVPLAVLVA